MKSKEGDNITNKIYVSQLTARSTGYIKNNRLVCNVLGRGAIPGRGVPPEAPEIHSVLSIEDDVFSFEEGPLDLLERGTTRAVTHLTSSVDDAVPGDIRVVGNRRHGVADLACSARQSCQVGNLAIGCNAASRDPSHDVVVLSVGAHVGSKAGASWPDTQTGMEVEGKWMICGTRPGRSPRRRGP